MGSEAFVYSASFSEADVQGIRPGPFYVCDKRAGVGTAACKRPGGFRRPRTPSEPCLFTANPSLPAATLRLYSALLTDRKWTGWAEVHMYAHTADRCASPCASERELAKEREREMRYIEQSKRERHACMHACRFAHMYIAIRMSARLFRRRFSLVLSDFVH